MMKRTALAVLCLCLAFAAGLAVPRPPPVRSAPDAPTLPIAPAAPASAPTDDAYKRELVNTRAQLAICLAYRHADPGPSADPGRSAEPQWDPLTTELVRSGTTNREVVLVRAPDGLRSYGPGLWPPPDGPPAGWHVISRVVDGGFERYDADGGVAFESRGPLPAFIEAFRDRDRRGDAGPPPEAAP
jgi:hypothetical protein